MFKKLLLDRSLIRKIPSVSPYDLATKARSLMRDLGLRIIVVVDDENRIVGVVWRENVLSISSTRSNLYVKDLMEDVLLIGYLNDDLLYILREMFMRDIWYIPVSDDRSRKSYLGVFGFENFFEKILKEQELYDIFKDLKVEEVMSREPKAFQPNISVTTLWRNMLKDRYAAYPVVNDKGVVIGIISQHDLLGISTAFQSESGPRRGPKISSVMTRPAITVKRNDNIINVIKIMVEKNIGRIPVVDDSNVLIGIIDRSDIIRSFLKKMGETYV